MQYSATKHSEAGKLRKCFFGNVKPSKLTYWLKAEILYGWIFGSLPLPYVAGHSGALCSHSLVKLSGLFCSELEGNVRKNMYDKSLV